jgi:hypothetical protein
MYFGEVGRYIVSVFGMLQQEKSGNPALGPRPIGMMSHLRL